MNDPTFYPVWIDTLTLEQRKCAEEAFAVLRSLGFFGNDDSTVGAEDEPWDVTQEPKSA